MDSLLSIPDPNPKEAQAAQQGTEMSPLSHTHHLTTRWNTISIPATYGTQNTSIPPGTVIGIVLGSVGGTVLLFYLIFLALNPGGIPRSVVGGIGSSIDEEEVVVRRPSRTSSRRRRSDVIEVVEERDRRRPTRLRRRDHGPQRVVVEESVTGSSAVTGDDGGGVVEVIEEEEEDSNVSSASPVPARRDRSRGYRTVDPNEFGGGSERPSRHR